MVLLYFMLIISSSSLPAAAQIREPGKEMNFCHEGRCYYGQSGERVLFFCLLLSLADPATDFTQSVSRSVGLAIYAPFLGQPEHKPDGAGYIATGYGIGWDSWCVDISSPGINHWLVNI